MEDDQVNTSFFGYTPPKRIHQSKLMTAEELFDEYPSLKDSGRFGRVTPPE